MVTLLVGTGCELAESPAGAQEPAGAHEPAEAGGSNATKGDDKGKNKGKDEAKQKGTALAALGDLPVKGRAPKTGYDRDQFGPAWADVDRNGCDTRNDILARDLTDETLESNGCVVLTGRLDDPYTATVIDFQRGQSTSADVQIDHVVALSDAWQKGAQQISDGARKQLANDPLNLWAADGPTNGAKGDGDAATWLPPNKAFRCEYVARQIAVKATYKLWVTAAERDAMKRVLSRCPDEPLPAGGLAPAVEGDAKPASSPAPAREPKKVRYESCAAVRDAGAAPIRRGDPGYGAHLDGDGDGVACE